MTVIKDKEGTWINQFRRPPLDQFISRCKQVEYVIIKYGASFQIYEKSAASNGIPWLGERMAESGAGDQSGPSRASLYANQLADQTMQPGCIGAVLNLEEADGGWHLDNGSATRLLIDTFKQRIPNKPLFASLDTRGNRPNSPYQLVCAEKCDGVMPMIYPGAFGLSAERSFASALTPLMRTRWAGKDIIVTYQTYSPPPVDVGDEVKVLQRYYEEGIIHGANSYTLGHATQPQWDSSLRLDFSKDQTVPIPPNINDALISIRNMWEDGWVAIGERGTYEEATAFLAFWKNLLGK